MTATYVEQFFFYKLLTEYIVQTYLEGQIFYQFHFNFSAKCKLYRVRQTKRESCQLQDCERINAGTETNDTSAKSP